MKYGGVEQTNLINPLARLCLGGKDSPVNLYPNHYPCESSRHEPRSPLLGMVLCYVYPLTVISVEGGSNPTTDTWVRSPDTSWRGMLPPTPRTPSHLVLPADSKSTQLQAVIRMPLFRFPIFLVMSSLHLLLCFPPHLQLSQDAFQLIRPS